MPFPLSYQSKFKFSDEIDHQKEISDWILKVESKLREQNVKILFHKKDSVTFKGRYYNLPELFPLLQMVSKGVVEISQESNKIAVVYNLKFTRMLIFAIIFVVAVTIPSLKGMSVQDYFAPIAIVGIIYWTLYYITVNRFDRFLKRALNCNVAS